MNVLSNTHICKNLLVCVLLNAPIKTTDLHGRSVLSLKMKNKKFENLYGPNIIMKSKKFHIFIIYVYVSFFTKKEHTKERQTTRSHTY